MSGGLPAIEKLEGSLNYGNWKFAMQMYLTHEDLWDCIEVDRDGKVKNQDKTKDKKALAKICLMVQPSNYIHVRTAKNARTAWENLQKAYEDKGLTRRLGLLRSLFGLKYVNFKSMEAYVTAVLSTSQLLTDIEAPVDDEFIAVIMLSGLPSEFNPMVMALENLNTKLSSDLVKAKLLQEDLKASYEDKSCNEDTTFVSNVSEHWNKNFRNAGNMNEKKMQQKKKVYKCFKCHKGRL